MSDFEVGEEVHIKLDARTCGKVKPGETAIIDRIDDDGDLWFIRDGEETGFYFPHEVERVAPVLAVPAKVVTGVSSRFTVDSEGVATDNLAPRSAVYFKPEGGEWQQIGHVDPDSFKTVESPSRELSYSFTISNPLPDLELLKLYTGHSVEQIAAVTEIPPQFILGDEPTPDETEGVQPDLVNDVEHYKRGVPGEYEVIDVIRAQGWEDNWYMASALKYLLRAQFKGSYKTDLQKAVRMIEWELSR